MKLHRLDGCAPMPLAHYLKALGVLRLVAEQLDPQARGWWEGERFVLASVKSQDELLQFFLDDYEPTPMLAPWNGASGFFRTWDPKRKQLRNSKNVAALERLLKNDHRRWNALRRAHGIALEALRPILRHRDVDALSEKDRKRLLIVPAGTGPVFPVADKDADKVAIQRAMARACPSVPFYRSAIVEVEDAFAYPSLFGSGGNDGAIDFTSRYIENLTAALCVPTKQPGAWLRASLFAQVVGGLQTGKYGKVGQFLPVAAGGANITTGPGGQDDTLLNPWDFILMMEGAVLFTAATARRLQAGRRARAVAPFAVASGAASYPSASAADESPRGEQWMPLWTQPATLAELSHVLAEGRAQIGADPAGAPLDLARAVVRMGTARGLQSFQRYGYIERNGQSNLAVPIGRFVVPDHAEPEIACLDDIDLWLRRLRREARGDKAPARLVAAEQRLTETLLDLTQRPLEPARWQTALLCMAEIEALQLKGAGAKAGPLPRLRPRWAQLADDGSAELRLSVAFALQGTTASRSSQWDGVRTHWLGTKGEPAVPSTDAQANRSRCVMQGRRGIDDAIAVVERRLVEAAQSGFRRLPLEPGGGAAHASIADVARVVRGEVDLDRCLSMARALMALDRQTCTRLRLLPASEGEAPDDAWIAIRLALLPWPLPEPDGRDPGCDPAIVRRLRGGDVAGALQLAARRLRVAGIICPVTASIGDADAAHRYAAALAFPITPQAAAWLADRLHPTAPKENPV